jgi:WD40 repeat protein
MGTPRATLTSHDGPVKSVAISPDGSWLATASGSPVARIWAVDGSYAAAIRVGDDVWDCA